MFCERKHNTVYRITNQINWKFYFGIHSTDNLDDGYFGSGKLLNQAVEKYGKSNFYKCIIADYPTRKEASDHEIQIITEDLIKSDQCYNLQPGGDNCDYFCHTLESIEKIRDARLGKPMSEECIEKRKKFWKENPQSLINKANKAVKTRRERGNYLHSDETKKLISEKELEFARNGGIKAKHYECEVDGKFFKTIKSICQEFNIDRKECSKRLLSNEPEWSEWNVIGTELPKEETKEYKRDKRFRRCQINNIIYDNFKIAAAELNLDETIIFERLTNIDFINYQFLDLENENDYKFCSKRCTIDQIIYNSMSDASRKLNVSWNKVASRINSKKAKWKDWQYYNEENI